ncbi:hypothetical protein HDU93_001598 [Gonapodya sp. JEL0774]|nr:hypothetical protein HDU93_001598 [Gonapodya sp. JEL0774]
MSSSSSSSTLAAPDSSSSSDLSGPELSSPVPGLETQRAPTVPKSIVVDVLSRYRVVRDKELVREMLRPVAEITPGLQLLSVAHGMVLPPSAPGYVPTVEGMYSGLPLSLSNFQKYMNKEGKPYGRSIVSDAAHILHSGQLPASDLSTPDNEKLRLLLSYFITPLSDIFRVKSGFYVEFTSKDHGIQLPQSNLRENVQMLPYTATQTSTFMEIGTAAAIHWMASSMPNKPENTVLPGETKQASLRWLRGLRCVGALDALGIQVVMLVIPQSPAADPVRMSFVKPSSTEASRCWYEERIRQGAFARMIKSMQGKKVNHRDILLVADLVDALGDEADADEDSDDSDEEEDDGQEVQDKGEEKVLGGTMSVDESV